MTRKLERIGTIAPRMADADIQLALLAIFIGGANALFGLDALDALDGPDGHDHVCIGCRAGHHEK